MFPFVFLALAANPTPAEPIDDPLPLHAVARLGIDRFCSNGSPDGLAVSPDGTRLAASPLLKEIIIWDAATGRIVGRCGPCAMYVVAVAFSPDGNTIAAATRYPGGDQKGPVVLF